MKEILVLIKLIKPKKSKQKLLFDKYMPLNQLVRIICKISPLITLIYLYIKYIDIKVLKGDIL